MNWTDEEIDKLFQESASQMNVPAYQDAFWSEMEALLPQEKKKKGLGWIFGGTMTCFALIAAMVFPPSQFSGNGSGTTALADARKQNETQPALEAQPLDQVQLSAPAENMEANATTASQTGSTAVAVDNTSGNIRGTKMNAVRVRGTRTGSVIPVIDPTVAEVQDEGSTAGLMKDNIEHQSNAAEAAPEGNDRLSFLVLAQDAPQLAPLRLGKFAPRQKNNTFYVQAGFGISQSYISSTVTAASNKDWMTSFSLGGGYQYRPQGFGFSAGLNLSSTFADNLEITRRSKVYNFSSTNYEQTMMYKQLYSVELPVSVDFRKNRHTISIGVTPTYLAGTVMRFTQHENGQLSDKGIYIGQRAGLNSFGLKTGVAYQLEVARSWNVGIQLNAQMVKQIDETQFVGELTKLPLSGQITIRKTLTK